jgi:spore coat protein A, manganese oxidase
MRRGGFLAGVAPAALFSELESQGRREGRLARKKGLPITRREFVGRSGVLASACVLPASAPDSLRFILGKHLTAICGVPDRFARFRVAAAQHRAALDPNTLSRFVDPLPIPQTARPSRAGPSPENPAIKIAHYRIAAQAFETNVHRDMKPTRMWGFGGAFPGPTFDLRSGEEVLVEWANELPQEHFLPIDHSLPGAEAHKPQVRVVSHLHGGKVPPKSDGYPEDWTVPGKSAVYHYPNQQDAAMLWYHDHAMGINRLNIFAGLAGAYILRNKAEDTLRLPGGKYEIPLIIADRMFDKEGQLYYPVSNKEASPWIPEFFGNANLVNGKLFPFLEVQPRKYRFRVLNASNARFYRLSLSNQQTFHQIGTDQGLLAAPVAVTKVMIAPGERLDLVIDFKPGAGTKIVLDDDFVPLLEFRVLDGTAKDDSILPATLRNIERLEESTASRTRMLSLDEVDDLVQQPVKMLLNGKKWDDPLTENPLLNSTEIWSFINPTDDSHPIHLHLVRFQILDRRKIERFAYLSRRQVRFMGPAIPPEPAEAGWKDTVRAHPGMLTRIIARFEGYPGRYVWHCHILEHEDNEMMRPYQVFPQK